MRITFRTNLDYGQRQQWPEVSIPPMVGDIVQSLGGMELQVVGRTFSKTGDISIELHLIPYRFQNISEFEEWCVRRGFPS